MRLLKALAATLLADFYKLSHRPMYPKNTSLVYSTWTPRASRMKDVDHVVWLGGQMFIKTWLIDFFNEYFFSKTEEEVVAEYSRVVKYTLGDQNPYTQHIRELHQLGYLPLSIKALPEGTIVPLRVPVMTIHNTDPRFFWLTNYIETLASCELWGPSTSATIAHEYHKIMTKYALETVGNSDFVCLQGHDFSMRGMYGLFASILSGIGHLAGGFIGTDTVPSILGAEALYNANIEKEMIGTSVPATEHSIQCTYGDDMVYLRRMLTEVHPNGIVSIVSDGYDFWDVIGRVIPALKNEILARKGGPIVDKVVIRPDSGDPVLILCGDPNGKTELERKGAVEALWDIFGGTVTENGYKLLDSHIGLIYGDAITLKRAEEIMERLKKKKFASINVVFGIGSYTYQYNTRDTFGFALKSTLSVVDGVETQIFKDPKTDNGIKKSQKGKVVVYRDPGTGEIKFRDGLSLNDSIYIKDVSGRSIDLDMLQEVFKNGKLLVDENFSDIRARIQNG